MEEAVVSMALGTLRDLLEEQVRFLFGVSGEVKALEKQLKEMKCLLKDAERQKHKSETVANWISRIRDLVYRAEDVIETYAFKVASTRRGGFLEQNCRRAACVITSHKIGSEILQIKSELATITKSMLGYGIKSIIQGESSTNPIDDENKKLKRITFPSQSDDCFVGKDQELKSLVSLVVEDEQHRLITIWGMGGIGKTTIARKVYNHRDVKRYFESFAWVCISQQCRIRSVLEDVLQLLNPSIKEQIGTMGETELFEKLSEVQRNKRCIIVLDDLWKLDHWNGLKHGFLGQGSVSKVMVTTRIKDVAAKGYIKEIGLLNDEDGWTLLKTKAFTKHHLISDVFKDEKLIEETGKRMVKKCGRLPLAISLLGGVLQQKTSLEEWKSIEMNINTSLHGESEMEEVLDLSFDELPHQLKPCFLYMGLVLKEDESTYGYNLYNMWIAQGMVSYEDKGKNNTLMDTAECYMSELVSRSLVQSKYPELSEGARYGGLFELHDLVWKLCLSKGRKEEFGVHIFDYEGGNFDNLWYDSLPSIKARHAAINLEKEMDAEHHPRCMPMKDSIKHIRSLLLYNNTTSNVPIGIPTSALDIHKFKLLKVLVFSRISFKGEKILRKIGNLIHLRELSLSECELDELPSSICNLSYLIILDLEDSQIVKMPRNLKNISRLKFLYLPTFSGIEICKNNQISLEGLDELEILYDFDSRVSDFKSLLSMNNLRLLDAKVHDNGSLSSIIDATTDHWKSLHTLWLRIYDGCKFTLQDREGLMILQKLFTCPPLQTLVLVTQTGVALLEECKTQMLASSIVRLVLNGCRIEKDPMTMLGQIPSLKVLFIENNSFIGENMMCPASSFPKLKVLVLGELPNLKEWKVEQGAMPLLSDLDIFNCRKLMMLPEGLRFLKLLKELRIRGMPEMGRRVSIEGEDYDKVNHVPSIIIY